MEKFGLSADEMFERFELWEMKEMMAGSKIYAEILAADSKTPNH